MQLDMCGDLCVNMCAAICIGMGVEMRVGIYVDMRADRCVDMCAEVCAYMFTEVRTAYVYPMCMCMHTHLRPCIHGHSSVRFQSAVCLHSRQGCVGCKASFGVALLLLPCHTP